MAKILIIGDIYFETQLFVDSIAGRNQLAVSSEVNNIIGSKTINAARVLSKLGNSISFFGRVGDDEFGIRARSILHDLYSFSTDFLATAENSKTGQVIVITDTNGKSAISIYFGANKIIDLQDINSIKNSIAEFDFVYSATNLPLDILYSLIDECEKHKVPIFIDVPNQHKLIDLKKLKNATFVAPNRQEAGLLLDMKIESVEDSKLACKKMREDYKGNIIITLDKDGCVVLEKYSIRPIHYPTREVYAVDETGSGDIFRAVFVSEFIKTKSIEQSIKSALKIASESVKLKGVDNTINNLDLSL